MAKRDKKEDEGVPNRKGKEIRLKQKNYWQDLRGTTEKKRKKLFDSWWDYANPISGSKRYHDDFSWNREWVQKNRKGNVKHILYIPNISQPYPMDYFEFYQWNWLKRLGWDSSSYATWQTDVGKKIPVRKYMLNYDVLVGLYVYGDTLLDYEPWEAMLLHRETEVTEKALEEFMGTEEDDDRII